MSNLIFMIEGGKALELVRQHISEVRRVRSANKATADELGVTEASTDRCSGVLTSIVFPGTVPEGWTKPDQFGRSRPKKGTPWHKRFQDQQGHADQSHVISEALGIPLTIEYSTGNGAGFRHIGSMLCECGFLWFGKDGPYAMWIPDVELEVAASEAQGEVVAEPAKSFRAQFDGCRRIEVEEWDILVAQHKLAEKKAAGALA